MFYEELSILGFWVAYGLKLIICKGTLIWYYKYVFRVLVAVRLLDRIHFTHIDYVRLGSSHETCPIVKCGILDMYFNN